MPGFAHVVARTFRGDGQAVELTRQANGEVADVDHLLYFAQAFLGDLARLPRHQFAQVRLVFTQQVTELAHQLTPAWRRDFAPDLKRIFSAGHVLFNLGRPFPLHGANLAAINRRVNRLLAALIQRRVHAKTIQ